MVEIDPHDVANWMWGFVTYPSHTLLSWWKLDKRMSGVDRAFGNVRDELCEVGLLDVGVYLDEIECIVAMLPSMGEAGYVYEGTTWGTRLVGFREGVIYLPSDLPQQTHLPGGTLLDTIRHEFGHAWHWLDPEFFERSWFYRAFGAESDDDKYVPLHEWEDRLDRSRKFRDEITRLRSNGARKRLRDKYLLRDFVSGYAATRSYEDFAETFMMYLKYRNSLDRFKSRPGVYRKLRSVERAVRAASKELF